MRSKKNSIPEYYNTLDAPIYVWEKVHETNDPTWLLVKRNQVSNKIIELLKKAWEKIYDEYIKEFGLTESFLDIKRKEIEVAQLKLELILTGDRVLETFIEIAEEELAEMNKGNGKSNFMESKIAIENRFKFQINMHSTSIREFYSYLKHLK